MILRACGVGFIRYMTTILWRRKTRNQLALARWSQQVALDLLDVMELEIEVRGSPPANGMLACNHLSYLDIIVLAAITPSTFISKHQVKYWPARCFFAASADPMWWNYPDSSNGSSPAAPFSPSFRRAPARMAPT
jgi:hypothetical protein